MPPPNDKGRTFERRCNLELVDLEPLDDEARYATLNAGQVSVDPTRWSQTNAHSLDQFP